MNENIPPRLQKENLGIVPNTTKPPIDLAKTIKNDTTKSQLKHNNDDHPHQAQQQPPQQPKKEQQAEVVTKRKPVNNGIAPDDDDDIDLGGYQKISKIGEGTYGIVYKGRQKLTNKIVALKKIRLAFSEGIPVTAMREIAILKEMKHHNVIGLTDLVQKDTYVYIVSDYLDMDLRRYMNDVGRKGMTPDHIKSYMHQLLCGLQYCHSHRVLHRDLKPQNLLIDRHGKLIIADLGLSRVFGVPMRTYTHQIITLWYRPPEILLGANFYSTAVDMWSVGCIFAEMMTLRPIFPGDSQIDELFRIFQLLGTPNEEYWPGVSALPDFSHTFPCWKRKNLLEDFQKYRGFNELRTLFNPEQTEVSLSYAFDLLQQLLEYDPCFRLSAKKAAEHPYFYTDITKIKF
ncbi:kinase-like domain-containing protein [Phascolomyces articulosus]|uniref:Cyclin-dependent kinase 1 n=1 Tax=Phascolomyces articulosus TaxID=60185 RepID=A0AAD5PK84_9FUNG|nr:kinase-like domain-containing protein [Phascolomyces articulosus]